VTQHKNKHLQKNKGCHHSLSAHQI